ncbi:histidine kinase [Bdellovibrio sp. ZAP7]|uniref:ATP-binding protein n=1 Tax=Bdellovibrio sp. ZAP7 TaxID=2231053 RepID=UPI00115B4F55|nr:ATP-binding protein [Bdellovibrio sp. ZAP7]QDK46817.1 histidine kinase [Bdellovibrio sp. ZAP7]
MKLPSPFEETTNSSKPVQYRVYAIRAVLAMIMAFLIAQINLDYVESWLYDFRIRSQLFQRTSEKIELVYIKPSTVQAFKGQPNAKDQTAILYNLLAAHPRAVVYDFAIDDAQGSEEDKAEWANLIVQSTNVYVATPDTPLKGEERSLYLPLPFDHVRMVSAPKTSDTINFAKDRVTRRMLLSYQDSMMLPVTLAGFYNPDVLDFRKIRGYFDFYDTKQSFIDYRRPGSFPSTVFDDLANGKVDWTKFEDKIVIIGTDLNISESDYILTPYSRIPSAMTRIEMQANIIDTLIRNSSPVRMPTYVNWILLTLISILAIQIVLSMSPAMGLVILVGTLTGFSVISFTLFWLFGWWITMAAPLLAGFLVYYFFIPYRLIIENRRSWEYYQKNKLLSQVEELKTNFISMMSHDLKTPIARIQGMTDVILADQVQLSTQQREAVDTIKHSSDDLLKFISSILNYGKIQSEGVELHMQTKDINNVLQEVIRKHEFLAKVKRIQIVSELEPLFPIRMDPDLMRQVLSNLVENAIKYSPDDTKILVTSEERDERVVIQVSDQGPGIPEDELNNIFMKFFRSKNVKSTQIKGSGLGLYLAKYFTELHKGRIFVESKDGKGSTFTVELPMEQGGVNA